MNGNMQYESGKPAWVNRVIGYTIILLLVFLLSFVPVWLQSRAVSRSLAAAEQRLALAQMQNTLATATIDARRGDYESAHQAAGEFFTALQAEVDKGESSVFSPAQSAGLHPLLIQRDEIVTLLARGDPAAAGRLSDLYSAFRELVK